MSNNNEPQDDEQPDDILFRPRIGQIALAHRLKQEVGLTDKQATDAVSVLLTTIAQAVTRGDSVIITNFGTFDSHTVAAHMARNPQTGELVPIPERKTVSFRARGGFRDMVRSGDAERSLRKKSNRKPKETT